MLFISECHWNTTTDVALLLDTSSGLTQTDFEAGVSAVTYLTNIILAGNDDENVRLSLVTFGQSMKVVRNLSETTVIDTLLSKVQALTFQEGSCKRHDQSENGVCGSDENTLEDALTLLNDSILVPSNTDSREVILIISNGRFTVDDTLPSLIEKFKNQGRFVFAVALGDDVAMETLQQLVNDPAYIFTARFQEEPTSLDVLSAEIFYSTCSLSNDFV